MALKWCKTPWGYTAGSIIIERRRWWKGNKTVVGYRLRTERGLRNEVYMTLPAAKKEAEKLAKR